MRAATRCALSASNRTLAYEIHRVSPMTSVRTWLLTVIDDRV